MCYLLPNRKLVASLVLFVNLLAGIRGHVIKFLFADKIFSYNLRDVIAETQNQSSTNTNNSIIISASLLAGSFICYVIVSDNMELLLQGLGSEHFYLDFEDLGSTSLLIEKYKQRSVLNLYSLKLANELTNNELDQYNLEFNTVKTNTDNTTWIETLGTLSVQVNFTNAKEIPIQNELVADASQIKAYYVLYISLIAMSVFLLVGILLFVKTYAKKWRLEFDYQKKFLQSNWILNEPTKSCLNNYSDSLIVKSNSSDSYLSFKSSNRLKQTIPRVNKVLFKRNRKKLNAQVVVLMDFYFIFGNLIKNLFLVFDQSFCRYL